VFAILEFDVGGAGQGLQEREERTLRVRLCRGVGEERELA